MLKYIHNVRECDVFPKMSTGRLYSAARKQQTLERPPTTSVTNQRRRLGLTVAFVQSEGSKGRVTAGSLDDHCCPSSFVVGLLSVSDGSSNQSRGLETGPARRKVTPAVTPKPGYVRRVSPFFSKSCTFL